MYAVSSFEKFINDHPELHRQRDEVMRRVRSLSGKSRMVSGWVPERVFSADIAAIFHEEVVADEDHLRLMIEAVERGRDQRK